MTDLDGVGAVNPLWAAAWAHRERLLRIARRRLGSAYDAEDCVQEAILRCAAAHQVDVARIGALLTTITVRLCVDLQRARARADRAYRRVESTTQTAVPADDEAVCSRVDAARAVPSLAVLHGNERAVFEARAGDLPPAETAQLLGITPKAAESAYARARAKLRRHVSAPAYDASVA